MLENRNSIQNAARDIGPSSAREVPDPSLKLLDALSTEEPRTVDDLARKTGLGVSSLVDAIGKFLSMSLIARADLNGEPAYLMTTSGRKLYESYSKVPIR